MPANHPLPAETLLANLAWRYAVKAFDTTKKISEAQLQTLLNAANFAPSSYGLQPYKMFVVETPAVREKLRAAAWNQSQITDSSHLVVFALCEKLLGGGREGVCGLRCRRARHTP